MVAALLLLWLALAITITILAARRFRLAEEVLSAARVNATLLELTPARPLIIRAHHFAIAPSARGHLVRDLGLHGTPSRIGELTGSDSGIVGEDLDALKEDVEVARVSAGRISRKVRASGSGRVFEVRGGPAPEPAQPGSLLLWFFDTSVGEEER